MSIDQFNLQQSEVIPPRLAIKSMRDSGYKNTAYALAELIDNSVQAGADKVEVFCSESLQIISERQGKRIYEIAVLDNGSGMTENVLRLALQFGNGTHLEDRKGIGRFGMGLPNASISQCRRVDVWTWQAGPENALHTYLDIDEIENGIMREIPKPNLNPLPEHWRNLSEEISQTGTLVLWNNFDEHRLTWKGANATLKHTSELAGRMYRKFINKGELVIRLVTIEENSFKEDYEALVNDPLYLMVPSSTPSPYNVEPMFLPYGKPAYFPININGTTQNVIVKSSYAKPDTWPEDGRNRGDTPYGKHAAKNVGVSILRAGRELDLDDSWTNRYSPTERWWGIEVEFPPALDEIFGVTNNKQNANLFAHMAQFDWKAEAQEGESFAEFKTRLEEEGDPRHYLLEIVNFIQNTIGRLRTEIDRQGMGRRSGAKRHDDTSVEDLATTKWKERAKSGHQTEHDNKEFDEDEFVEDLVKGKHFPENSAREIAEAVRQRGRKIIFIEADADTPAFFQVTHSAGVTEVVLNRNHPAYNRLIKVLDPDISDSNSIELVQRIQNASDTFRMLLAAWARYEDEDLYSKDKIAEMRYEWGKMARGFLSEE